MKVRIRLFFDFFIVLIAFIPGQLLKLKRKKIWILSERESEAKDNAYWLFRYINCHFSGENVFYAITADSKDYSKIKDMGNTIEFGGFKHCVYTWAASMYISTQYSSGLPNPWMYYMWLYKCTGFKFCFLQHGVTKDGTPYLKQPAKRVSLICCVAEREAALMEQMGYRKAAVQVTGFCRYDGLVKDNSKKQILIMPTWRNYLAGVKDKEFTASEYYKSIMALLNNDQLASMFSEYKILVCFHPGTKKYIHLFHSKYKNVEIVDHDTYSFQSMICQSEMLITDYSSVSFDFAYLLKPVFYFQFDDLDFQKRHLQAGDFDYKKDGFGPVYKEVSLLVKGIEKNRFTINDKYNKRAKEFFTYRDKMNCKRVYDYLMKL